MKSWIAAVLGILLVWGWAVDSPAQQTQPPDLGPLPGPVAQTDPPATPPEPTAATDPDYVAMTSLMGQWLANAAGERVGQIMEVIIDRRTGQLAHLVLSITDFLSQADLRYVIPWGAVTTSRLGQFQLNLAPSVLRNAPSLQPGYDPALLSDSSYLDTIYDYYGYPRPARSGDPEEDYDY